MGLQSLLGAKHNTVKPPIKELSIPPTPDEFSQKRQKELHGSR